MARRPRDTFLRRSLVFAVTLMAGAWLFGGFDWGDLASPRRLRNLERFAGELRPFPLQGQVWDWSEAAEIIALGYDVILAGGLNPDNVGSALGDIGGFMPWGVDVATGVEVDDDDHRKDPEKMRAFVEAVRRREESVEADKESGEPI